MAIKAAMRRAHAAGRFEQFAQSAAGAMQLHGQGVGAHAALGCKHGWATATQVHATDQVAVLLRQFGEQALEAGAEQPRFLGTGAGFEVRFVAGESAFAGTAPKSPNTTKPSKSAAFKKPVKMSLKTKQQSSTTN